MARDTGIVIWEGKSELDGAPIALVATGLKGAGNTKTGAGLVQTYIIRTDINPVEAVKTGADASICGDCPHRGAADRSRSCYVRTEQGPLVVFKAMGRGVYRRTTLQETADILAGRGVRLGAYGDPAAVPFAVWAAALARVGFTTGYTHQWRNAPELAQWAMASCDSPADRAAARFMGFRTFRIRLATEEREQGEVVCPASAEAGFKTTCDACKACGGHGAKAKADIVIAAHGVAHKVKAFEALRATIH